MDLLDFFDEFNVEYFKSGKNVTKGWINVQCPFCDDQSNHCGIRKRDLRVSCWKCGGHRFFNLITTMTGISYEEARSLRLSLTREGGETNPPFTADIGSASIVNLPPESTIHFPKLHREYLRDRGFPPLKTIRKYKLRAVHTIGQYCFRIIIPVYMDRRLVSFTSRDVTDQQEPKYLHSSKQNSIIDPKNAIYNYDRIIPNGDAIMVEGPADVWKMGDGCFSIFGVQHTEKQLIFLKRKNIRRMFLLLDNDKEGKRTAKRMARIMAPLVKVLEIVTLDHVGDPGELTLAEAQSIKYELGFNL